jgi:hypothetical protein
MDLVTRLRMEVETRKIRVLDAKKRMVREEAEAKRERRAVPRELADRLADDIREAKKAVESCQISLEAACKYPPLNP